MIGLQELGIIAGIVIVVALFGKKLVKKGIKDAKEIKDEFTSSEEKKPETIEVYIPQNNNKD